MRQTVGIVGTSRTGRASCVRSYSGELNDETHQSCVPVSQMAPIRPNRRRGLCPCHALRDLAGLIVVDFIDMEEGRNNRAVERRIKDALKNDRARIQVGRISHFGLLEMSRQRIRASVLESSTEPCPHCGGSGHVRSVSSVALQLLRGIEEILMKGATHNLVVRTRTDVALYVLNQKRGHLRNLETSFKVALSVIAADNSEMEALAIAVALRQAHLRKDVRGTVCEHCIAY